MGLLSRLNKPKSGKGKTPPRDSGKPKDSRPSRSKKGAPPPPEGLTLDQKLDIVGILLILSGAIIIFAFLSPNNSAFTKPLLDLLGQLFGLGKFLAPVGLIVLGGWIVLRHFGDRLPRIPPERVLGFILLFVAALVSIHFFVAQTDKEGEVLARAGEGGGWIGYGILQIMLNGLGTPGAVVAVFFGWIISLILASGMSTQQLIAGAQAVLEKLRPRSERTPPRQPPPPSESPVHPPIRPATPPSATPPPAAKQSPPPGAGAQSPALTRKQRPQQPALPPVATAVEIPPAPPSPMFDQPIIIGGQQPWVLPKTAEMLEPGSEGGADDQYDRERVRTIEDTLGAFGAPARVVEVNRGPTITQFGVEPYFIEARGGRKTRV
ncbi:MAG: DNA translocase FtsK 4TM domain-containing protein, partial [Chloroflexota bacterium]